MRSLRAAVTLVALLQLLNACSDRQVAGPSAPPVLAGRVLSCTVDVGARTMSCTAPPSLSPQGGRGITVDLVLGGQGTYVALRSSNVSYNAGTSIFQAAVTVQNLTALPLGTADGSTVTGVKVFFYSGPDVVSGSGTVTVANASGTGTFTGTNQPYFLYNQILTAGQTSSSKTWQWVVPSTVQRFAFQVLVDAAVMSESPGSLVFAAISTGDGHTCGLTTTGTAYCWGDNLEGNLSILLQNAIDALGQIPCVVVARDDEADEW